MSAPAKAPPRRRRDYPAPIVGCSEPRHRGRPGRRRRGSGRGFLRDEKIYVDETAPKLKSGSQRTRRLPDHRRESSAGYSSAGCSPAEPASASPASSKISGARRRANASGGNLAARAWLGNVLRRGNMPGQFRMSFESQPAAPCRARMSAPRSALTATSEPRLTHRFRKPATSLTAGKNRPPCPGTPVHHVPVLDNKLSMRGTGTFIAAVEGRGPRGRCRAPACPARCRQGAALMLRQAQHEGHGHFRSSTFRLLSLPLQIRSKRLIRAVVETVPAKSLPRP